MNDPFELQVESWLRGAANPDAEEVAVLIAFAESLTPDQSSKRGWVAALAAAATLVAVTAFIALRALPGSLPPVGHPPYSIASNDPRFARCGGAAKGVIAAFPMARAADYHAYLPAMGKAPELETAVPAFVVVFDATHQWAGFGGPATSGGFPGSSQARMTYPPNHFDVCVWVGDVQNGDFDAYAGVDITGIRTALPGASPIVYPPVGRLPVASCRATAWPETVIACDTANAVGRPKGARVTQTRIWLTSLSSVTTALHPSKRIGVAPDTEVWVIVFDGSSLCCPTREPSDQSPSPLLPSTRWIVAVDATGRLPGFVYYLDWSGQRIPTEFPEIAP